MFYTHLRHFKEKPDTKSQQGAVMRIAYIREYMVRTQVRVGCPDVFS
jgi:hypothetical protein